MIKFSNNSWKEMSHFTSQLILGRWFIVFASLLIMAMSGAGYLFGLYSNQIKTSMGYDQSTLNLLGFFKDLAGNVGVISGLLNEVTPPWVVLALGAAMNFFGYFMIWLAVTGHIKNVPVWQMCLYIYIGANSQTFSNTGALVTCVKNFPESRGIVLGLLKGFVGLSGAILTQLYHVFYGKDSKAFILFIGWLPALVSLIFIRCVRYMKVVREKNEVKIFYNLLYISLSLAGFLMILIIVQNNVAFTRGEYYVSAFIIIFLLFLPIVIIVKDQREVYKSKNKNNHNGVILDVIDDVMREERPQQEDVGINGDLPKEQVSCWTKIFQRPNRGDDYSILEALFSFDMMFLFLATACGLGGTLTVIDNMGQLGRSLGYPTHSITTFLSLISIWNYLGRVLCGFASEVVLVKYKFPRPMVMTLVLLLACIGHLLIAFDVPNSLYVASIIIGFCLGAQWPLVLAIISELFGLKHYAMLHTLGGLASPVGSYVLNVMITGKLYDKEALKQLSAKGLKRKVGEELTCIGAKCHKVSFLIISGITFCGSLISLILVLRTKKFRDVEDVKKPKCEKVRGGLVS
ncbi:protein NUCLEAR FUSION DEFECTIVE 4-like [Amaranthus tricolor]|uniref:protein NUCLEAR FUSION DEFECTIVE 4-like n=1 Tax=Amaranthus tricolor TaxID=29722 RepID=UPI002588BC76|nr:protein NUCLEAR FUSION DEFECTIVE 4-like [Amaranthus tricolor]